MSGTFKKAKICGLNVSGINTSVVEINGISISGFNTFAFIMNGLNISLVQNVVVKCRGIQVGLFNRAKDLRGVQIGDGAIIGADTVVTKDIPNFAIAVGNPAKVIKYRFNKKDIELIKKSKWWEYDLKEASKIQLQLQPKLSKAVRY